MKCYKHRDFCLWAKFEKLTDTVLVKAVDEINNGLYEAALGSGLYKKRIAIPGKGKRSGYRTLLAFKHDKIAFFIYGFAKNEKANLSELEEKRCRGLAKILLGLNHRQISELLSTGKLVELKHEK